MPESVFSALYEELARRDLELPEEPLVRERLNDLRSTYEPYANALARHFALAVPAWMPTEESQRNWEAALWQSRRKVRSLH